MSRRTAESSKAIAAAWENEKQRVAEGKGTRDWTPEQQQDILDCGKAYDENGKAFEGQHMRSAEIHPECQGDPTNIQFLTREEHLAAHRGDWRNPTNGYFDPVSRVMTDFGDGPIVPCPEIELSNPVVKMAIICEPQPENKTEKHSQKKSIDVASPKIDAAAKNKSIGRQQTIPIHRTEKAEGIGGFFKKAGHGIKKAATFVVEHKEEIKIIGIAVSEVVAGFKEISDLNSKRSANESSRGYNTDNHPSFHDSSNKNCIDPIVNRESDDVPAEDRNYPKTHASPREHMVSGHGQHYNTKEGRIWKEKDPYPRRGKHADD